MIFDFDVVRGLSRKIMVEEDPQKVHEFLSTIRDILREELKLTQAEDDPSTRSVFGDSSSALIGSGKG